MTSIKVCCNLLEASMRSQRIELDGGNIFFYNGHSIYFCPYCGTKIELISGIDEFWLLFNQEEDNYKKKLAELQDDYQSNIKHLKDKFFK